MMEKGMQGERKRGYRHTVRLLQEYLRPVDPRPSFSRHLEDLCRSMGADEFVVAEAVERGESASRRRMILGGAVFSALPFLGVAAYAIGRHLQRRRVVAMGV
jgi:hypothetical protein